MVFSPQHYFFLALSIAGVLGLAFALKSRKKAGLPVVALFALVFVLGVMGPNWLFNLTPTPYAIASALLSFDADSDSADAASDSAVPADIAVAVPAAPSAVNAVSDSAPPSAAGGAVGSSVSIAEIAAKPAAGISNDYYAIITPGKTGDFQLDNLKLTQSSQDIATVAFTLEPPASSRKSVVVVENVQSTDVVRIAYSYDLYGVVEISLKNGEKGYASVLFVKAENAGDRPTGAIAIQQELPSELAQSVDDVLGCSVECTVTKGSVLVTLFFDGIQPGEQKTASVTVKMDSPVLNKGQVLGQFKQPVAVASNQEVQLVESKQPNAAIAIFGLIAVLAIAALVARFFIKPE